MDKGFTNDAIPALSVCESPIEGRFIQAWFDAMRSIGTAVEYVDCSIFKIGVEFRKNDGSGTFSLGVQGKVQCLDGGRVDAVVSYREKSVSTSFVVELDGRDFHLSTERQQKDKGRDRELLFYGLPVVRYAGSEVYSSAPELVDRLIGAIVNRNENQWVDLAMAFEAGFEAGELVPKGRTADESEELRSAAWNRFVARSA